MNRVELSGRVFKELKSYETKDGNKVVSLFLNVDRDYTLSNGTTPHDRVNCVAFGDVAEQLLSAEIGDGTAVSVIGKWYSNAYKKDGNWVNQNQCNITSFEVNNEELGTVGEVVGNDYMQVPDIDDFDVPF